MANTKHHDEHKGGAVFEEEKQRAHAEEKKTQAVDLEKEGFHYNDETKSKLLPLGPGQAYYRTNDGELIIGDDTRGTIYSDQRGEHINKLRQGDFVKNGQYVKDAEYLANEKKEQEKADKAKHHK